MMLVNVTKKSSFSDNSGTRSSTILCWVDMCVWRLGAGRNTQSEILIICPAILRYWLLASKLRSPILQPCKRCSVLHWNLNDMSVTHDKHCMSSKEWTRMIYVCNDEFNLSLGVGFHICSTDLPRGTYVLCLIIIDGCGFFSKPWRLCINSDYGQLPSLYQVWRRLCVMYPQLCHPFFQKCCSIMNDLDLLVYDDRVMSNIKFGYYNSGDAKGSYCVICQFWLRIMRLDLSTFKVFRYGTKTAALKT